MFSIGALLHSQRAEKRVQPGQEIVHLPAQPEIGAHAPDPEKKQRVRCWVQEGPDGRPGYIDIEA